VIVAAMATVMKVAVIVAVIVAVTAMVWRDGDGNRVKV
jgi:hypothetical protein